MPSLDRLLEEHSRDEFPAAIEKGRSYGEVDPVMIDADLYGWALAVHRGGRISPDDRRRLDEAAKELQRSMTSLPLDAGPYYERLLELARATLRQAPS